LLNLLGGLRGLILNLTFVIWAVREYKKKAPENFPGVLPNGELSKA
jgi:hypothetical protein